MKRHPSPTPEPPSTAALHQGHRQRVYDRLTREGLAHFTPHQVLELLLFHTHRQGDTNELAHQLLRRFGSLAAVLEANEADLAHVDGIGPRSAAFLTLMPQLARYYLRDKAERALAPMDHPDRARDYLIPLMTGRSEEVFYVLCLDSRCRLLFPALLHEGTVNRVVVEPRHIIETALRHKASQIILAHNHPSGNNQPSAEDIRLTQIVAQVCLPIGIHLADHLIVADDQLFSFNEAGLLAR
ncbi:MAG: DNA repair protein RadC [Magnetococcales bacterium]|nr:DNA repair protein RadC [Magnetococcales bacterium]